jgi:hypothetical protein
VDSRTASSVLVLSSPKKAPTMPLSAVQKRMGPMPQ